MKTVLAIIVIIQCIFVFAVTAAWIKDTNDEEGEE